MSMGSMSGMGSMRNSTSNSTMSGGDMGGMDMGGSCKISMLWNWYTLDTCFLSATWHNKTKGMFAGSVIGVFFWCMAIELVRRLGREYDRRIVLAASARANQLALTDSLDKDTVAPVSCGVVAEFTPSWIQQIIRSFAYGTQFSAAFLVMLIGMYYNGFMLIAIFLGQTIGFTIFGRDTVGGGAAKEGAQANCC